MGWTEAVDGYCERLDPGLWAEPVNALTNLAFLVAAAVMWRRVRGLAPARALAAILAAIGIGSGLFHTVAQRWAGLADVLPIALFILVYLYEANRQFWGLRLWPALGLTALFFPYAALATPGLHFLVPGLGGSAAYATVALLIALYALALVRRAPDTARGLGIGAALLTLSIAARAADTPLCPVWPLGTHFLWHLLNAVMLGWMIEVMRRHMLAARRAGS
ncbi:ceramidase domain-containing protein [Acidimangrovimonas pyrenivorans]|uniref:Ceramidase domain-containing protein n=1 Tax=Acidimangrovimonas pyrenivorans TaxID=2030798 RepID=A0ABV7AL01_9RHOB